MLARWFCPVQELLAGADCASVFGCRQIPSVNARFDEDNNGTSLLSPGSDDMVTSVMSDSMQMDEGRGAEVSVPQPTAAPQLARGSPSVLHQPPAFASGRAPSPPTSSGLSLGRRMGGLLSRGGGSR